MYAPYFCTNISNLYQLPAAIFSACLESQFTSMQLQYLFYVLCGYCFWKTILSVCSTKSQREKGKKIIWGLEYLQRTSLQIHTDVDPQVPLFPLLPRQCSVSKQRDSYIHRHLYMADRFEEQFTNKRILKEGISRTNIYVMFL
jgi:hypothetical protein